VSKKKIVFIINPISGGKNKKRMPALINRLIDKEKFEYRISFTERVEHAFMLSKAAVKDNYDIVVAVGGDGTINEVAKAILNTNLILGIVPFGSGNGLARSLKIPMSPQKALEVINRLYTEKIDSGKMNEDHFFNMAGAGFDAHISHAFASNKIRGFGGYVGTTFKELSSYKPLNYQINIDGKEVERKAFIVSVANSSQYGNEAHIAPHADVRDGILDVVIVKPFPWYKFPSLAIKMFTKTADKSSYVEIIKGKNISIKREKTGAVHLDGEPKLMNGFLNIEVLPKSITVIVPEHV
jgi:diacylglycerol kinase (ATP)